MGKLDYIDNDFARGYVQSHSNARRGVFVPMTFIDLCDGNMYDAILFSQLMYWHQPSNSTGEAKMQRKHNGHLWVAKNHSDWYQECRIKSATVRKSLNRLKKTGLVIYELHGEKGLKTPFIRINWDVFEDKMKALEPPVIISHPPDTIEQGVCPSVSYPLLPENEPNTESTSKNTHKKEPRAHINSDLDAMCDAVRIHLKAYGSQNKKIAKAMLGLLSGKSAEYNVKRLMTPELVKRYVTDWDANHILSDGTPLTRPRNLGSNKSNVDAWWDKNKPEPKIEIIPDVAPQTIHPEFLQQMKDAKNG